MGSGILEEEFAEMWTIIVVAAILLILLAIVLFILIFRGGDVIENTRVLFILT